MKSSIKFSASWIFLTLCFSCSTIRQQENVTVNFDQQAHRGGRGLMPENTIASQKNAIDFNCTLEMDLQMSKDKKIVVSHDSYFHSAFSLTPEGDTMTDKEGKSRRLFNMTYDSIAKYDVGLKPYPLFPRQKKIHAVKPLLSVLIDSVEAYALEKHHVNHYNIEIKSSPKEDGMAYSTLKEFVDEAMKIIIDKGIQSRTMIQSFDKRALNLVHENYPGVQTSFLVSINDKRTAKGYVEELGFKPDIFSPQYRLLTPQLIKEFHKMNMRVIPWTVNTAEEIQKLKDMGVDGVITDYPDLFYLMK